MRPRCCPTGSMPPVAKRSASIALSLTRRLNLGDKLIVYRGEADGKEKPSRALATAAAFARSDWERLPGNIVGLLWHAITPVLDESIHLYTIAQSMNVQPLAPPLSFEEQWFRLLYERLGGSGDTRRSAGTA